MPLSSPDDLALPLPDKKPVDVRNIGLSILAVAAVILVLKYAQEVFIPFVLSGLLFYALDPVVSWLQRMKIPRALSGAVILLGIVAGSGWLAYHVRDQALAVVDELPQAARNLRTVLRPTRGAREGTIDKIQRAATEIDKTTAATMPAAAAPNGVVRVQVEDAPLRVTDLVWWGSVGMVTILSESLMVLLLTYFLLLTNDRFKRKLIKNFGDTLSEKKITVQIVDQISAQIGRFLVVQVFTGILVAVATGLSLWGLGLRQATFWGITAGVLNSIPYFGPVIVTAGLSMVAFMQFGTLTMALAVAGTALLITTLEGWLLTPLLLGRAAGMNQVAVFASLIFWSWLWGFWGMFLAVPMMMMLKAICDHIEGLHPARDFLAD